MPIAYPAPLRPGDRIAVTAPSSGVEPALHPRLDLVIEHLRTQGFIVEEGQCLRDEQHSASAPAAQRAAELMHYLLREDIAAIIPPWGGERAIELLDRLDWVALRAARPKWLLGFSDTSTWLLPVTLRLGWATAHGPGLMDLAPGQDDPLTSQTLAHLATAAGGEVRQRQSALWQLKWTDFAVSPDCTFNLTETTRWQPLNAAAEGSIAFGGRLIGGCIDTLMHTAGTEHGDVRGFIREHAATGVVLFLENSGLSPTDLVRALHRLRWSGWLDGLAGLLMGRSAAPDTTGVHQLRYADALTSTLGGLACPVLWDVCIGHLPPQMLLVNGALATVTHSPQDGGAILQRWA